MRIASMSKVQRATLIGLLGALFTVASATAGAKPLGHDGQIAFSRYDPLADRDVLYRVNPDGSHEQQVLSAPIGGGTWSPDGTRIAGVVDNGPGAVSTGVVNPDNGNSVVFPPADPDVDNYCFVWSPDGASLACETHGPAGGDRTGISTIRSSDGGGLKQVTTNLTPWGNDVPSDYSPDGRRLVFGSFGEACICIAVVNVNGTGLHHITNGILVSSFGSWSPRGNQIVFSRHATEDVHSSLWVMHSDGSGLHEIHVQVPAGQYPCGAPNADPTAGGCFDPRWSPDGKKIVFGRGDDELGRNVYSVNTDGSGLTQVTHGGADQSNEGADWGTHPLAD